MGLPTRNSLGYEVRAYECALKWREFFFATEGTVVSCFLSDCCMSPIFSLACRLNRMVGRTFSGLRLVALRLIYFT